MEPRLTLRRRDIAIAAIVIVVGTIAPDVGPRWWLLFTSVVIFAAAAGLVAQRRGAGGLDLRACTVEEIGAAWEMTTVLLGTAIGADKLRLVRIRQAYLDELDRRDPAGLAAWTECAARGEEIRLDAFLSAPTEG
jgi:hypothetical protein